MERLMFSGLTMSLVLTAVAFGASGSAQNLQGVGQPQINIRIHDYAKVSHTVMEHAEQMAGRILKKAGIDARWIDCSDSLINEVCYRPITSLDFLINLLPESMSDRLHQPPGVLGSALEGSGQSFGYSAWIFYDLAKDRAIEHQVDIGDLLGNAIAHELGHLLLGTNSHAGVSLMSAFWSVNQYRLISQGRLSFSAAEVKRMHASMSARELAAMDSARQGQSLVARNSSE